MDGNDYPEAAQQLDAIEHQVAQRSTDGIDQISALAGRSYDSPVEDVWHALTDPDRLRRWFLPVTGDLRVGGAFQTEGNAGGEILLCEPPRLLRVTWGDASSVVELRLQSTQDGGTTLQLEHTVPLALAGNGTGVLYVGPGWDSTLVTLGKHLRQEPVPVPQTGESLEEQQMTKLSLLAWATAIEQSGTATDEEVAAAIEALIPQWAPDL